MTIVSARTRTAAWASVVLSAVASVAVLTGLAQAGTPAHGLALGLRDPAFGSTDCAEPAPSLDRAKSARASVLPLGATWSMVAPARPDAAFDPRDPGDPGYDWSKVDASVRDAVARGAAPAPSSCRGAGLG
jgi:hypothetical protein